MFYLPLLLWFSKIIIVLFGFIIRCLEVIQMDMERQGIKLINKKDHIHHKNLTSKYCKGFLKIPPPIQFLLLAYSQRRCYVGLPEEHHLLMGATTEDTLGHPLEPSKVLTYWDKSCPSSTPNSLPKPYVLLSILNRMEKYDGIYWPQSEYKLLPFRTFDVTVSSPRAAPHGACYNNQSWM